MTCTIFRFKFVVIYFLFLLASIDSFGKIVNSEDIYEINIYTLKTDEQISRLDNYLQNVYIPAIHRMGIKKVGVFKVVGNDTAVLKKIYVIVPFTSIEQWDGSINLLNKDKIYTDNSGPFLHATVDNPSYDRVQKIITKAFPMHPRLQLPKLKNDFSEKIYELRSYESPTDHLFERKVSMFNKGDEIGLFKRLNFNAIFYSSVIAGNRMPNLMYMISFENMKDHDEHWKQFGNDPQWKKISTSPEYENKINVSHIDVVLMHAAKYSEI